MQKLLEANSTCADCFASPVYAVDIVHGVFLCEACSEIHTQELKFPIKCLDEVFLPEEISFLTEKGNESLNRQLCKTTYPWFATPKEFPFLAVRQHWAKAKYIGQTFAVEPHKTYDRTDLNQYWFYLDEVTSETPEIVGPITREDIKGNRLKADTLLDDSFVWHPVLGKNWVSLDKIYADLIDPETALADKVIYDAYEKRQELLSHPLPHLRGYLDIMQKSKTQRKWLTLRRQFLNISIYNYPTPTDVQVNLDGCDVSLIEVGPRLAIKIVGGDTDMLLNSASSGELLEWFNTLRCTKHLLMVARPDDLVEANFDVSEQSVCNVRTSPFYMGIKKKEGFLKKEGSSWKSIKVRWFILRTQGLYYYASQGDKNYRGMLQLQGARVSSVEQYKFPNHFVVRTEAKALHLWAEDEAQREAWVEAIQNVATNLSEDFWVYQVQGA